MARFGKGVNGKGTHKRQVPPTKSRDASTAKRGGTGSTDRRGYAASSASKVGAGRGAGSVKVSDDIRVQRTYTSEFRSTPASKDANYVSTSARQLEAGAYSKRRRARERKNALVAVGIVAAAIVVVLIILALMGAIGGQQGSDGGDSSTGDVSQASDVSSGGLANDGSIVMALAGSKDTYLRQGEDYIEGGCYAYDKTDGPLTSQVTISGDVDSGTVGDYTITYTVQDSAGMVATAQRTVHVVAEADVEWDDDGISVFMYHDVYDSSDPPEDAGSNDNLISTDLLDQQLSWLNENDYYYPSWAELRAYINGTHSLPAKSVVLTFDDCTDGFLAYGIPLHEKYQIPATSFVVCNREDLSSVLADYASEYVTYQSHSYGLHQAGSSSEGHGGKIYDLSAAELTEDLTKAAELLGTNDAFAYPYGDVSQDASIGVSDAGTLCALTTAYGQVHSGDDPTELSRMRVFGTYDISSFKYQAEYGEG